MTLAQYRLTEDDSATAPQLEMARRAGRYPASGTSLFS